MFIWGDLTTFNLTSVLKTKGLSSAMVMASTFKIMQSF